MRNIIEVLKSHLNTESEKIIFRYIDSDDGSARTMTFKELDKEANKIANELLQYSKKDDRVLMLYPSGLEFISAFIGCLYAGVIAVPVYPPKKNQKAKRLKEIVEDCQPTIVLTTQKIYKLTKEIFSDDKLLKELPLLITDQEKSYSSNTIEINIKLTDVAFLQYTSGSTGTPKGVMVTHKNIMANMNTLHNAIGYTNTSIGASWLPLFHDMGLMGSVLQPIYIGFEAILMSPTFFLQKPIRWINILSKYKVNATMAPNFGYEMCINSIVDEELEGIDLSHLKIMLNGAEPIAYDTIKRFSHKFFKSNFNDVSHYPCYGMAETTLFLTGGDRKKVNKVHIDKEALRKNKIIHINEVSSKNSSQILISCGHTWGDEELIIVDPKNHEELEENMVGEIWAKGSSIAKGYWNQDNQSKDIFEAFTKKNDGPYLRTGDLGFLYNKELYICGRLKNLLIIRGRNYYPQDIEKSVYSSHKALVSMGAAVFTVEEEIIVIQEVKRTFIRKYIQDEVFSAIQESVGRDHELKLQHIILVRPGQLLKTSSGKIQHYLNKEAYLNKKFKILSESNKKSNSHLLSSQIELDSIESFIIKEISLVSGISSDYIDVNKPFINFGLDSISIVNLTEKLSIKLGKDVSPTIFYDYPSIYELSSFLQEKSIHNNSTEESLRKDVAIIGLDCNFPDSSNIHDFIKLLENGDSPIRFFSDKREKLHYTEKIKGGYLDNIELFDASFFNISTKEAKVLDPQQRLLLEVSYNALRSSGYSRKVISSKDMGVFIGISHNDYGELSINSKEYNNPYIASGNALNNAANRLSYFYNITGPSMSIDTACSSSLSALHVAINSIHLGECTSAFVGGVNLILNAQTSKILESASMLSPDEKCKVFDDSANGYVRGEGCGVIIIKSLDEAEKDNDYIYAVIKGSAIVQDGTTNGLSAPNGKAQAKVITKALQNSKINADEVTYVEAHGTGTKLGDPIEVDALSRVYGNSHKENNSKFDIGSVKANIGHLESAAGIASIIKATLMLDKKVLYPQINILKKNTFIEFDKIPLRITNKLLPWESSKYILGVSSFGFGGTNVHTIIQNYKNKNIINKDSESYFLFSISSQNYDSSQTEKLLQYIEQNKNTLDLKLFCYGLSRVDENFSNRQVFVFQDIDDLIVKLSSIPFKKMVSKKEKKLVMLFNGEIIEYINVAKNLIKVNTFFSNCMEECFLYISNYLNITIDSLTEGVEIKDIKYKRFIIFSIETSLARYYEYIGITSDLLIGKNFGEYSAAYIGNLISLEDGFFLIDTHCRLDTDINKTSLNDFSDIVKKISLQKTTKMIISASKSPNINTLNQYLLSCHNSKSILDIDYISIGEYLNIGEGKELIEFIEQILETNINCVLSVNNSISIEESLLISIKMMIENGYDININNFYEECLGSKIFIPEYNYLRKKHWVEHEKIKEKNLFQKSSINTKINELLYKVKFEERILDNFSIQKKIEDYDWIIVGSKNEISDEFLKIFSYKNVNYIFIQSSDIDGVMKNLTKTTNIVFIDSINDNDVNNLLEEYTLFIQRLLETTTDYKYKYWVLTSKAQNVKDTDVRLSFNQSTLWGFSKSLQLEHKNIFGGIIDYEEISIDIEKIVACLLQEVEPFIAIRDNKIYVQRLIKIDKISHQYKKTNFKGVAVISGGKGALGIETLKWLVKKGVKTFYLLSRNSVISSSSKEYIDKLELDGIVVNQISIDIGNMKELKKLFDYISSKNEDIKHIFHLAGIDSLSLIQEQDIKKISDLISGKVNGAKNLDYLSRYLALDTFVMYSSSSSIFGAYGKSIYSASNAYLDILASERAKYGLPALSINWGAWKNIGFANTNKIDSFTSKMEIDLLEPIQAFDALEVALENNINNICIQEVKWSLFKKFYETNGNSSFLENIICDLGSKDNPIKINSLPYIRKILSEITEVLYEEISNDKTFIEYGFDSLMILELQLKINKDLGIDLKLSDFYEYPTVSKLYDRLNELLISQGNDLTKKRVFEMEINKEKQYDSFPLNDIQQAYLLGKDEAMTLGNTACFAYAELKLSNINLVSLENAWDKLIERHSMLRCEIDKESMTQRILPLLSENGMKIKDISDMTLEDVVPYLNERRELRLDEGLSSEEVPLLEMIIYLLPNNQKVMHIYIDMLICDASSIGILLKDLKNIFDNPKIELPKIEVGFKDYLVYKEKYKKSAEYIKSLEYWKNRIDTLPAGPKLPLKVEPKSIIKPKFSRRKYKLDSKSWNKLKSISRNYNVTPTVMLLTLYAKVLSHWVKEENFCINLTLFDRIQGHKDVNSIIGDFTSLNPLEIKIDAKIKDMLKEVHLQLLKDLENKEIGGIQVFRELRNIGHDSEMPVVFTSTLGLEDLDFNWLGEVTYAVTQTPQVWIDNQVSESNNELIIHWDCIEELFEERMLDSMFSLYHKLIRNIIDNPKDLNKEYLNLSSKELNHVYKEYNKTKKSEVQDTLPQICMLKAIELKEKEAVVSGEVRLSYKDLHNASAQIAEYLESLKIQEDEHVAILLPKGWEQIVSILGCGYAGVAYLPMSINYPKKRIDYLLKEAKVKVVLGIESTLGLVKGTNRIDINSIINFNRNIPIYKVKAMKNSLMYTIFTSGSTGVPKGVMLTYGSVGNTVFDINERFNINQKDTFLALSELNFDLSVYDIYGALSSGAKIVIPQEKNKLEPSYWFELVEKEKITLWNSVPTFMQLFCEELDSKENKIINSLRLVLLSGDFISIELVNHINSLLPKAEIISLGGATEAAIWSIYYPIIELSSDMNKIPYGYPLSNQEIYILDKGLHLKPLLVEGDIYIKGKSLSLGYLNDPKKTNLQFIKKENTEEVLYKTGDVGYFNLHGNIEIVGRSDNQIKIRGFRIELGEIEQHILKIDNIKECVVLVHEDDIKEKILIAYIVETEEKIEEEFEIEGVISDIYERIEFKIAQHANSVKVSKIDNIELPNINNNQTLSLTKNRLLSNITNKDSLNLTQLSLILNCFRQVPVEEHLLPKYYYPSAGSLYPVQVYLYIPKNKMDIEAGYYHYNRSTHQLNCLKKIIQTSIETVQCYFIGDLNAITPMYGPASKGFCYLEAGHMLHLFEQNAMTYNISIRKEKKQEMETVLEMLELDSKRYLTCSQLNIESFEDSSIISNGSTYQLSLNERQSYRDFEGNNLTQKVFKDFVFEDINICNDDISVYIYIKDGGVTGYEEGFYLYEENQNLKLLSKEKYDDSLYQGNNKQIYMNSSFVVFLTEKLKTSITQTKAITLDYFSKNNLMTSGFLGQEMMISATKKNIGLCPIGFVNLDKFKSLFKLRKDEHVIYSFLGGSIHSNQTSYWKGERMEYLSKSDSLQLKLKEVLPQYMVPSKFINVKDIPLNSNGKVDKKALLSLDMSLTKDRKYVAPRDETEKILAKIFSEILNIEKVGIYDNFFELGGHSLLATQVISKIRNEMQIELPLKILYKQSNIKTLSEQIKIIKISEKTNFQKTYNEEIF